MIRTRTCKDCGAEFSYEATRGRDRNYCNYLCRARHQSRRNKGRWHARCSTPECGKPANRVGAGVCEACYYMIRRTGKTFKQPRGTYRKITDHGYVTLLEAKHPMSGSNGVVYEHRMVLYDAKGPGPHLCHWCGQLLGWKEIVVDHLNENKQDNRLENLVVACSPCNRARGALLPFVARMHDASFESFITVMRKYRDARAEVVV